MAASSSVWAEAGGWLDRAPEDGALDRGVSEVLKVVLVDRLEGVREGGSDCWRDRSSGSESAGGPAVVMDLGGCGGVGS